MQLIVAERLLGKNVALLNDGVAILDLPPVAVFPLGQILAVEEDDGIGRRVAGLLARSNDLRFRPDGSLLVRRSNVDQDDPNRNKRTSDWEAWLRTVKCRPSATEENDPDNPFGRPK
jgi:hypothetical protein